MCGFVVVVNSISERAPRKIDKNRDLGSILIQNLLYEIYRSDPRNYAHIFFYTIYLYYKLWISICLKEYIVM